MSDTSDTERLGIREARDQLTRRVEAAHFHGEATIITKNEEPRAVIVPYAWFIEASAEIERAGAATRKASKR